MHTNARKIATEPRLEERAGPRIERLAQPAQHLVHDRRSVDARGLRRGGVGFVCSFVSSSSHSAHLRLTCGGASETASAGSGMRITASATTSALALPTVVDRANLKLGLYAGGRGGMTAERGLRIVGLSEREALPVCYVQGVLASANDG